MVVEERSRRDVTADPRIGNCVERIDVGRIIEDRKGCIARRRRLGDISTFALRDRLRRRIKSFAPRRRREAEAKSSWKSGLELR
jgi:hypothetical protein